MLRNAARIWGQPNSSLDAFDPLVGMLLGATSVEVSRVYNDLESSQSRVLERLSSLLTPDVFRGPRAAHAIGHARPQDPSCELSNEFHFYVQKRLPQREGSTREESAQVFFTPSIATKLFDAQVRFMAGGTSLYSIERINERVKISDSPSGVRLGSHLPDVQAQTLYIGLEVNKKLDSLKGMSFLFDWLYKTEKSQLFQALAHSRWFIGDRELRMETGVYNASEHASVVKNFEMDIENDICKIEERDITSLYNPRFITIVDDEKLDMEELLKLFPKEFEVVFESRNLKELKNPLLWLRVEFMNPRMDITDDMVSAVNCFPLVSRHLNEFSYRLQNNTNIIPLKVDGENFYSICAVRGSDNKPYTKNTSKDFFRTKTGSYMLRQGGVERFDRRDASEMLSYLIDLLRDESASFAVYGNELISGNLRELNQMISALYQRVGQVDLGDEQLTYLVVKPNNETENIFVEFWSTQGMFANQIRGGSQLTPFAGFELKSESIQLITASTGGKNAPESAELLQAYRKALMTRGRVVTANDIRLFIQSEDEAALIQRVEISRGFENSPSSRTGLSRTIQVTLYPKASALNEDWPQKCFDIEMKLRNESSAFFPIRVKWHNPVK